MSRQTGISAESCPLETPMPSNLRGWLWSDLWDAWLCGLCDHANGSNPSLPPDSCSGCGQGGYETYERSGLIWPMRRRGN